MDEETPAERRKRYRRERKARDPEGWKKYRREMKQRMRERRRDPNRLRRGELAAMPPEKRKAYARQVRLRQTYGLPIGRYDEMVAEQVGRCGVCFREEPLVVDHCHASGVVRGLLCNWCNTGLGFFRDNPEALRLAAGYLERSTISSQE